MADETTPQTPEERYEKWRGWIAASRLRRQDLLADWQRNVDFRRGKPFESASDDDRIAVNKDWSMTKTKQAQLFSQVPKVRLVEKNAEFAPAVPVFAKLLNDTLDAERVGVAMDEVLPDVINAAGIGAVVICYEATTEQIQVPQQDPMMQPVPGMEPVMVDATRIVDRRFPIRRVSAADLLWPKDFEGSDFEDAPWIGRSGRLPWADSLREFGANEVRPNGLTEIDKEIVTSNGTKSFERLSTESNRNYDGADLVEFDEIFYWRHCYHLDEKHFKAIHRLVFVAGKDVPVIDEAWQGQRVDTATGAYVGSCERPIQVLTLSYISDDAIPPSDSAIGRPQVNELIKSRSQMIKQREHSLPLRWFDVDRVDAIFHKALQNGTYQGFIPTQGDGSRAIGEVARASFPREDFEFDKIANRDLEQSWSLGPNQAAQFATGERSAAEARIVHSAFQTEIGYQRARVETFFIRIAKVVGGLLALYGDFEVPSLNDMDTQRLQAWNRESISNQFVYAIRSDSTVLLDAEQRIQQLTRALNLTAQSGFVNPKPIIREIMELSGLDPDEIMVDPQPKPPEPISISAGSPEDFLNPLMLAILMRTGQAPSPEELEAAKRLLAAAFAPPAPQAQQPGLPPTTPPQDGGIPPDIQTPQQSFPEWEMAPRIDRRRSEEP